MKKVFTYLRSILLSPMWIMLGGGGGGGSDINKTTTSQQALWGQYAKDWNTYIAEVEPRTEYGMQRATNFPETQSRIVNQMRTTTVDKLNPVQGLGNKQSLTTNLIRSNAGLGSALAGANVRGEESAKDYQSSLLGNILAAKMGSKAGSQTALGTFAGQETTNYLQNLQSNQEMNMGMNKAGSSAIGSIGMGLYGGANKTQGNVQ